MSRDIVKVMPGFMAGAMVTASVSTAFPIVLAGAITGAVISYNLEYRNSNNDSASNH